MFHQHTGDAFDLYTLEHRFTIGWALAGVFGAVNVAATVLMLLAQA
jgi:hypothetical protein